MAPPRQEPSPPTLPQSSEYAAFMDKLAAFHEKRGTELQREPRVGSKFINLLDLFNVVVGRGGYDKISDEKLAWRKLGQDWNLPANNLPALAFGLKTVYYKNLAAFEIAEIHKKDPPPREILEDLTAKGGALLSRTVDNYKPARRETGNLGHHDSEASGDDGTPSRERNGSEETPGSGGRVTRGLRQAPPQRVLFQPEVHSSSRQTRHVATTSHTSTPQHHNQHQLPRVGASSSYTPSLSEHQSQAVERYEPRPQMPLTLRPVITPGNNAVEFSRRQKAYRDTALMAAYARTPAPLNRGVMLPGSGFDGPNIYVRCLCALKSGIPSEQEYALHHLVKISMERGDKYKFESFPGLAEALIEKVLEVSSLLYKVKWRIAYTEDELSATPDTLNGIDGTPDILQRISKLPKLAVDDNIQPAEFSDVLLQVNEAGLTLRNMVMLEENALYVSEMSPLRDFLTIALNLPKLDCLTELKHYALDIAEQLTKYLHFEETDPLYISLLAQLQSEDRGAILTCLRAISRISMTLEENNTLKGIPSACIQNILDWTLLNDDELLHACLDILYQYTAVVANVDFLTTNSLIEPLVNQLTRLLAHGANQLLKLEEPERSSQWLRCLFEEDRDEAITQIALWQEYQACFAPTVVETGRQLLPAAEFIKNVSTTFAEKAAAQVQPGPIQKFIIKGIRMRSVPVDLKGEPYSKCYWKSGASPGDQGPCNKFFMSPEEMYRHILRDHVGAPELEDGKFDNSQVGQYTCEWEHCRRFKGKPATKLLQLATHIKVHLPPRRVPAANKDSEYLGPPPAKKLKPSYIISPPKQAFMLHFTAVDERHEAAGVPLSAVLVLRNLARNLSKTQAEEKAMKLPGAVSWVDRLFKPVSPRLYETMAHNKALTPYITDLINAMNDA
ncbi:Chromatin structure-remodeling complex subunit [Lachnellula hyalina]|uniref:Chromatin structure-remodeling complex subunit n=1 Tax=Lachnellula hyalina TaxID=1316788 RepID=A0A8H8RCR8_9HELO|nr:Chromatin structure-remodeling complex subunit [Lachnellula hyalina]TVY30982.1 Chromatin structure-remodeling complex subunit [Lachnellula hyalina]